MMTPPWTTQLASDIVRDGLGLELLDASGDIAAEIFRCDADHAVTMHLFSQSIPSEILQELISQARETLGEFEDGTALPEQFKVVPHAGDAD